MAKRILLVDVGNTSITLGIGRGRRITQVQRVDSRHESADPLRAAINAAAAAEPFAGAVVCSVVPRWTRECAQTIQRACAVEPVVVTNRTRLGLRIDYPRPNTIGPDRLANAAGAVRKFGCPVIVADFGTALTFDIVSDARAYIGGVIMPGLPLMADYLAEKTALLPHIRLQGPHGAIGKSTQGAMRIGAKIGYRGMVREVVAHVRREPEMKDALLCATGGFARWVLSDLDLEIRIEPNLTLYGLQVIYELNTDE